MAPTLHVNPQTGSDRHPGSATQPLKTLTAALSQSAPGTTIHLGAGVYSQASGERFPLVIGPRCRVVGSGNTPQAILQGGGSFTDGDLGTVSLTCSLGDQAQLEQVRVVNPEAGGVGLWLGGGRAIVQSVQVQGCGRYGIASGHEGIPTLVAVQVTGSGVGVAWFRRSKGVLIRGQCQQNGLALGCYQQAAPLIQQCAISQNRQGILVTDQARPVLRGNTVDRNQEGGLLVQGQGDPDLGSPTDLGQNVLRHNSRWDLNNSRSSGVPLALCGNDVVPQGLQGGVTLLASALADPQALIFPETAAAPPPAAPLPPNPNPTAPTYRFSDLQGHWAGAFIEGLAAQGAVQGFRDGSFQPQGGVTRAQFAALVVASFPQGTPRQAPLTFRDVAPSFWGATAIAQAQQRGFLQGYPDGSFRPDQGLARIEAIVALVRGLNLPPGRGESVGIYRDRAQVPSYAMDALAAATQHRLVVNAPDPLRLRPLEPITRGELAALVYQARVHLGLTTAMASPFIVEPDSTQPLFTDIRGHWAEGFIRGLALADLVRGMEDGRFLPDAPMNRAQYAALVVSAFRPAPQRPGTVFQDVAPTFWGAGAIDQAYRGGFVSGFPDQTYGPNHPLLRVQVWVSVVEGTRLGQGETPNLNLLGRFTDYTDIPRYALNAMAIAARHRLLVNHPVVTQLRCNQVATRGETCAIIYQALVAQGRLPAIASGAIAVVP